MASLLPRILFELIHHRTELRGWRTGRPALRRRSTQGTGKCAARWEKWNPETNLKSLCVWSAVYTVSKPCLIIGISLFSPWPFTKSALGRLDSRDDCISTSAKCFWAIEHFCAD